MALLYLRFYSFWEVNGDRHLSLTCYSVRTFKGDGNWHLKGE